MNLRCWFFSHDWEKQPITSVWDNDETVAVCGRCGREYTVRKLKVATDADSPPIDWLNQSHSETAKARYLKGEIDEQELEQALEAEQL